MNHLKITKGIMIPILLHGCFALASIPKQGGAYEIITDAAASGSPHTAGGNYNLICAAGQPGGVNTSSGNSFTLYSGYIAQLDMDMGLSTYGAPQITRINPSKALNTRPVILGIQGYEFSADTVLKLLKSGSEDIVGYNMQLISETQLVCTFDVNGKTEGLWNLLIITSGGQDILENGLLVYSPSLAEAHPYPVPFRSDKHNMITFTNLPGNVEIKIYDITGEQVISLKEDNRDGVYEWDVLNKDGEKTASGTYIYLIIDEQGSKKTGKLMIIR